MDIYKFSIVFYAIAAIVLHLMGEDPVAFIALEASIVFVIFYWFAKSEDK